MISPENLTDAERALLLSKSSFYIAGPETIGLRGAKEKVPLGSFAQLPLTYLALRQIAKGTVTLDEPLYRTLPDLLEDNSFKVAITLRHILTETAGFAVPDIVVDTLPLERYTTSIRTAGQVPHHDPVGWAVLIKFLETRTGKPLSALLKEELFSPLGLPENSLTFTMQDNSLGFIATAKATPQTIAGIARLTVRNFDKTGARYLPPEIYKALTEVSIWRMHPMGPARTLGLHLHTESNRHWLETDRSTSAIYMMSFPRAGLSFIKLDGFSAAFQHAVLAVAHTHFLPDPERSRAQARHLIESFEARGYYSLSTAPSYSFRKRIGIIKDDTLKLSSFPGDQLLVSKTSTGEAVGVYKKELPFYYKGPEGSTLTLSTYKQGGYMVLDNTLYRYTGLFGNRLLILDYVPLLLIFLLSSGVYIFAGYDKSWRNMAVLTITGTLLSLMGTACEYYIWETAIYRWDMPFLVTLWRIILNIGLALVLSQPLFALSFSRNNKMPDKGIAMMLVPLHLGLISIAALWYFLVHVAWGTAATF